MEALIFYGLIIGAGVWWYMSRQKKKEKWEALPQDGPMQVNIEEDYNTKSRHVPCGLKIDVKISQADWKAIHQAGLMKKVLFHGDGPSGKQYDPENVRPWTVEDLQRVTMAMFWDADRMHQAKEELIESLRNLRAHVDNIRHGSKKDSFEL